MKKIIKKHYDLPKVENHFIEKKVSDLVDGDLILEFLEYKSHTRADFLEEPSCQKNLYKVFIFRETKKTLLKDNKSIAITFDEPIGLLSFDFLYAVSIKIKRFFGLINTESYYSCSRFLPTVRHIGYFLPQAYHFKEGESITKVFKLDEKVFCLKDPDVVCQKLNVSNQRKNDRRYFTIMNYYDYLKPVD